MSTWVVKLGGEVVKSPDFGVIAADLRALTSGGERMVLVHGGGPQVTALQKKLGKAPQQIAGRRITDDETLEAVKMAVAGQVNVDLTSKLFAAGLSPVGLHGGSSGVLTARKRPPVMVSGGGDEPIDFGHVGDVTAINGKLLELLLGAGYTPVLACLGADREGNVYNINADTVANDVSIHTRADGLVLLTDVPGVLVNIHDPSSRIATLTEKEGRDLVAKGIVVGGMIAKLEEAFSALGRGVRSILIVGKLSPGDLARAIREPKSVGTWLVREEGH